MSCAGSRCQLNAGPTTKANLTYFDCANFYENFDRVSPVTWTKPTWKIIKISNRHLNQKFWKPPLPLIPPQLLQNITKFDWVFLQHHHVNMQVLHHLQTLLGICLSSKIRQLLNKHKFPKYSLHTYETVSFASAGFFPVSQNRPSPDRKTW